MMWPLNTKTFEVEKVVEKVVTKTVDRIIVGAPGQVDLYRAFDPGEYHHESFLKDRNRPSADYGYFLACADAFSASDNRHMRVDKVKALVIDGEYMTYSGELYPVKVTKPKKAKGKS